MAGAPCPEEDAKLSWECFANALIIQLHTRLVRRLYFTSSSSDQHLHFQMVVVSGASNRLVIVRP